MSTALLAAALLLIIVLILSYVARGSTGRDYRRITKREFMSKAERETITYLEAALPNCRIHAQVAMGALLKVKSGTDNRKRHQARGYFSQKVVDFVAEDRATGEIIALIELDDRSHNVAKDKERDLMTKAGGYLTIRLPAGRRPTLASVRQLLDASLPPA